MQGNINLPFDTSPKLTLRKTERRREREQTRKKAKSGEIEIDRFYSLAFVASLIHKKYNYTINFGASALWVYYIKLTLCRLHRYLNGHLKYINK